MSRLQCQGSIVLAAIAVALLSSRPADAQNSPPSESEGLFNKLIIGVEYDIVNQAMAEHRLEKVQTKFRRDAERGDSASLERDARRIGALRYRIMVDEWLIRKNLLQDPGPYPHALRLDPISCAAIADAARPALVVYTSQSVPPPVVATTTIPITIINSAPAGPGLAFAINGLAHQSDGGSRQELAVAPGSTISYDGGGSLGERRYRISPGHYEFRVNAEGWTLYKLPVMP